jgi:Fe-Mn family superoxide dismutase
MQLKKAELPPLPYSYTALEPVLSKETLEFHHDKHHAAYVAGTNTALEKLEKSRKGEIEINTREVLRDLSFNLNGHILHSMYWANMKGAQQNNTPGGRIGDYINRSFGSFEAFAKEFSATAKTVEASGWAALTADEENNLYVVGIEKHNLMPIAGYKMLLVNDVFEHAYYIDYKNNRGKYVDNWWSLLNWDDVEKRLGH